MIRDYSTNDKKIGTLYKKFVSEYKLPINYFFKLLIPNKQLNIYYKLEDRTNYLSKWKNRLDKEFIGYTKEQFMFYKELCEENKYIKNNENDHYTDDGCICDMCKQKRKELVKKILSGCKDITNYKVKHKLDNTYNGIFLFRIYEKIEKEIRSKINLNIYNELVINYFNYF
jgi:hypothetical protein